MNLDNRRKYNNTFKKHFRAFFSLVIAALLATTAPLVQADSGVPETKNPMKLMIIDYSGDNIILYIYDKVFEASILDAYSRLIVQATRHAKNDVLWETNG